ncbi:MAG: ABC transporter ATP-binding protein [Clostridia bacterium]|nr:ABC transporter ATP-binding protein [Clostridia bacterium]
MADRHRAGPAIEARALRRVFQERRGGRVVKEHVALEGIDLEVRPGECFGLLGANGAGKTTLIKILCTLLLPTSGEARVLGMDVRREAAAIRRRINMVSGGEHSGYGILTVRESLWLFSQLYGLPNAEAFRRIDRLLAMVDLDGSVRVNKLSTGMRQKMNFARGFLNRPDVLFLDEPTLGLDVQTARRLRGFVREWVEEERKTVLLTTHYMMEADEICDRIAIISGGRILACDTPANLKRSLRQERVVRLELAGGAAAEGTAATAESPGPRPAQGSAGAEGIALDRLRQALGEVPGVRRVTLDARDGRVSARVHVESDAVLVRLVATIAELGLDLHALEKQDPTLEDVFLALTGHRLEDEGGAAGREP